MMTNNSFAYVFPGQGSQAVGMLGDIAAAYREVSETFEQASAVLGYDLWSVAANGPAEELNKTIITQPALLTASYAIWKILNKHQQVKPSVMAGHSLGEYTALVCANAISFADAVRLVEARGKYMQEAVAAGKGAMAAIIGLDDNIVTEICEEARHDDVLSPANYNSIGQVVVAGAKAAVERAVSIAKERGARMAVEIPVSVPSHCELMLPAAERLQKILMEIDIRKPEIPVINNADVSQYQSVDGIRDGLVKQLYMPVRWVETITTMKDLGVTAIIECGPGKVLSGLIKRIDKSLSLYTTNDSASLEKLLKTESERN